MRLNRELPGAGWLALLGGGEFSFGETLLADRAWIDRAPEGPVGFLPTASGSADYGLHLADYLAETFGRETRTVPVYRPRDARRGRNLERVAESAAVYLGGGVADELLRVFADSPALEAVERKMRQGGVVVAVAAAAQATGRWARSLTGGQALAGLGWLEGVVETNFDPGHDRRLRWLVEQPGVERGLGLPTGSACLFGPDGEIDVIGPVFVLDSPDGDLKVVAADGGSVRLDDDDA